MEKTELNETDLREVILYVSSKISGYCDIWADELILFVSKITNLDYWDVHREALKMRAEGEICFINLRGKVKVLALRNANLKLFTGRASSYIDIIIKETFGRQKY